MPNLVKVMDAKTGELKRWEMPNGKPLALIEDGKLVLTEHGKRLGYKVVGNHLEKKGERRSYAEGFIR